MDISYSRVALYRKCPMAHYLRYVKHLKKKGKSKPLYFGTDFHKLLENRTSKKKYLKARKEIEEAYDNLDFNERSMLGDNYLENLFEIFSDYRKVWNGSDKPIVTEQEFKLPLIIDKETGEVHNFIGIIDELYEGYTVIGEHKTFSMKPSNLTLTMNTQSMLYAKAVKELYGVTPTHIRWDYIKSEPASFPVYLKGKRLSSAKSQSITPYSWLRACKEYGCEDQKNMALAWEQNISNFFFRLDVSISDAMVERIWKDFKYTAKDLIKRQEKNKVRNVTRDCSFCDFKDICKTEFTGGNVDYIIDKDFEVSRRNDEIIKPPNGLSDLEIINWLQRYVLIHSIIYYNMDNNAISDKEWNKMALELVERMKDKKLAKKSEYWRYYKDFDGNTGFDIVEALKEFDEQHYDYLFTIATNILTR